MMMTFVLLSIVRTATPTSGPSGSTPAPSGPSGPADVTLSGYYFGILLLATALAVIAIALYFAFRYHTRLLDVIKLSVLRNDASVGTKNEHAFATAQMLKASSSPRPMIVGPDTASPSTQLAFGIRNLPDDATVGWTAEEGTPPGGNGPVLITEFEEPGKYEVAATYTLANGEECAISPKKVTIGAPAPSSPAIILPFVIQNWGRLVVVIFGIGVIAALMSTGVLESVAGVGILGTLLGVGAVAATGGTGGEQAKPTKDE